MRQNDYAAAHVLVDFSPSLCVPTPSFEKAFIMNSPSTSLPPASCREVLCRAVGSYKSWRLVVVKQPARTSQNDILNVKEPRYQDPANDKYLPRPLTSQATGVTIFYTALKF